MNKVQKLISMVAGVALLAGCAVALSSTGEHKTLEGKLVLKGSMPMVQTILVQPDRQQWELMGVPRARAEALQNRQVVAQGVVVRPAKGGFLPPGLRVTSISEMR